MSTNPFKSSSGAARPAPTRRGNPGVKPGIKPGVKPSVKPPTRRKLPPFRPVRTPDRKPTVNPRIPRNPKWSPGKPIVFGKRPPYTFKPPGFPVRFPWGRYMPAGIIGGFLIAAWYSQEGQYQMPDGWTKCWDLGGPKNKFSGPVSGVCGDGWDQGLDLQVPNGTINEDAIEGGPIGPLVIWLGPEQFGGARMKYMEKWEFQGGEEFSIPEIPYFWPASNFELPSFPPWIVGQPYPLEPAPIPWAPPVFPGAPPAVNPSPEGNPTPEPYGPPAPVVVPGNVIPSVDLETSTAETPITSTVGTHIKEPPTDGTKEKKTRLTKKQTALWLAALTAAGTSYMELDDFTAALYKGLHWKVRRWRGKDGVWRDRDITTADRLTRLYTELGKFDVWEGLKNVATQEATDLAIGKVGQMLAGRAAELGKSGLWNTPKGFQYGNNLKNELWQEQYAMLKHEAAKRIRNERKHFRFKRYNRQLNRWVWDVRVRPVSTIPWYRQESMYAANRLTGAPKIYYAPRASENPIKFPGEALYD